MDKKSSEEIDKEREKCRSQKECMILEKSGHICGMAAFSETEYKMFQYLCQGHTQLAMVAGWKFKLLEGMIDKVKDPMEKWLYHQKHQDGEPLVSGESNEPKTNM